MTLVGVNRSIKITTLLVLFGQGIAGCESDRDLSLPLPPATLQTTEEYAFGTQTGSLDTHFWTQVWDTAEARFGEEGMRLERYVLPADESWQALKGDYAKKLGALTAEWKEAHDLTFSDNAQAWSFAYRHDDYFVAWVGLKPSQSEGGLVPVNFITNMPERPAGDLTSQ